MTPKVSIIIPVYNGSNYLREAIDSALSQTYSNLEVIVVNDGSRDNGETERIAKSYGASIIYVMKENGGVSSALNKGIELMSGEYFSWLSHDDLYHSEKIARQMELVCSNTERDIIICSYYASINAQGGVVKAFNYEPTTAHSFRYWITWGSSLNGCTLLIPKTAFDQVGNFNTELLTSQDYDLWFRMAESLSVIFVREVLVYSRTHAGQTSLTMSKRFYEETNQLKIRFYKALKPYEYPGAMDRLALELARSTHYQRLYEASLYISKRLLANPFTFFPALVLSLKSIVKKALNY